MKSGPIYLDYNATTPCDPRVLDAMLPYFGVHFANPSSVSHLPGRQAADAVEAARDQVASILNTSSANIIFTAGATESNNLALYGAAHSAQNRGDPRRRILTLATEHKAVLEPCRDLEQQGFDVQYVPIDRSGVLDLDAFEALLTPQTLMVSIQAANSEIGTLQPLDNIAQLTKEAGAWFHCDATQALGRIALDLQALPIDLLSLSGHKIYGPKGGGALVARRPLRQGKLTPQMLGGGQESKLRAGTQNVPAIVGLGAACEIMEQEGPAEAQRLQYLRDFFESSLLQQLPKVCFNGHPERRLPNTSSVTVPGLDADALLANLPGLALSLGSACNAGAIEPSYVLTALGVTREEANSTFRMSLGRWTQKSTLR